MKSMDTIKYIDYLEITISSLLKDRIETGSDERSSKWYEKVPFELTLCWVSNCTENPAKGDKIRLIADYQKDFYLPFRAFKGMGYKYATQLTDEELLESIVG